jgi:membrane-bound metal-dependent hydrolase YbcI (DUF457 family)
MTAVNHAVTGSIIAATINNPAISLPLALVSHFVLDALPHFGAHTLTTPRSKEFKIILYTDGFLTCCFLLIVTFVGYRVGLGSWLLPLGAILAILPDLMWYKHYRNDIHGQEKVWDPIRTIHKRIQQWEVSWGWIIEVVWFLTAVMILHQLLFS